jgi:glycosyltransferase involved in cell wall biosynthesis
LSGKTVYEASVLSRGTDISPVCVIIPTYNRSQALGICLQHLEKQSWTDFEVIVVDDGSTDSTPQQMEQYLKSGTLRLRYFRQENSGPAKARNFAVSLTQSPLCLIIGDDIFAEPDFVKTHLQFHQENPQPYVAALGLTRWCESRQNVTQFMRWLDESGTQFSYHDLLAGATPSWKHFYTSNLSLKTEVLRKDPFSEVFTKAAVEDLELGYRLEVKHGLKLVFLPEALAHHLHPTNFRKTCQRMYMVGYSWKVFHELWPEQQPAANPSFRKTVRDILCRNQWVLPPVISFMDILTRFWCPTPLIREILNYQQILGYRSRL